MAIDSINSTSGYVANRGSKPEKEEKRVGPSGSSANETTYVDGRPRLASLTGSGVGGNALWTRGASAPAIADSLPPAGLRILATMMAANPEGRKWLDTDRPGVVGDLRASMS